MRKQNSSVKLNIFIYLVGILLCLTLVSVHMTSGLYARYTASATGQDSARVAVFNVEHPEYVFNKDLVLEIAPRDTEKEIVVKNSSEVAINYTITIENATGNIPLSFKIGKDNEAVMTETRAERTYFMGTKSEQTHYITISWPETGSLNYMGMVDKINVTLVAEQID